MYWPRWKDLSRTEHRSCASFPACQRGSGWGKLSQGGCRSWQGHIGTEHDRFAWLSTARLLLLSPCCHAASTASCPYGCPALPALLGRKGARTSKAVIVKRYSSQDQFASSLQQFCLTHMGTSSSCSSPCAQRG